MRVRSDFSVNEIGIVLRQSFMTSFSIGMIPYRSQWQAALSLSLGAMTIGATAGWTSPYIAKLTKPDCTHPLKLTYSDASWIASVLFIGRLIGAIFAASVQEFIGRKKTLLCMCLPMAVGWTLIIVAPSVSWLYASRILTGVPVGILLTASASFLGEIADPMIRGSLISVTPNGLASGTLLGVIMGGYLPMEIFSYICLSLTGLFFVVFFFIPESPYYHMANGDLQNAEKSLQWYKKDTDIKCETEELQSMVRKTGVNFAEILNEFKKIENRKNFLLIFLLTGFPYWAGLNSTEAYAEIILTKSKVAFTPSVVVMVLAFSAIVAGMVPILLIDRVGRRRLLIGSGLGLCVGHILLGSHFHMLSLGIEPKSINWLPVFSLFLVYLSMPCGLSTVRDSLLGELFSPILKTPASFIFTATSAITCFIVTKCFQPYVNAVGEKYVFWTFATIALSSVVFSYFCIPETKQMRLIDIQKKLKANVKENKTSGADIELMSKETCKALP